MQQQLGILTNYQSIGKSPLNSSRAKQLFSFPKAQRFDKPRGSYCNATYDLPSTRSRRSASIGIGSKVIPILKSDAPSPQKYRIASIFEHKKSGHTFGIGRDKLYKGNKDVNIFPGPGQYAQSSRLSTVAYSLRPRIQSLQINTMPGPGHYETISTVTDKYPLSTYKKPAQTVLKQNSKRQTRYDKDVPGPGQYDVKLRTHLSGIFSKERRQTLTISSKTPGVGEYELPSEFGRYGRPQRMNTIY